MLRASDTTEALTNVPKERKISHRTDCPKLDREFPQEESREMLDVEMNPILATYICFLPIFSCVTLFSFLSFFCKKSISVAAQKM